MLRRFVPLLVLLGVSLLVLLARLWDIQIVQHEVWSTEAVNLVRSYGVDPYVRGALKDRDGRLIARDEEVYALEFVWRDFRRGHPLGQVAMMRSLMLMRPVGLDEARPTLAEAAQSYAALTPNAIDGFAEGLELDAGIDYVPALAATSDEERREAAVRERRGPRAGDLRYYIMRLLHLSPRQIKTLGERIENGGGDHSFLALAAELREQPIEAARQALEDGVVKADLNLSRLASLIDWSEEIERGEVSAVMAPGDRLIPLIEERRREVDDDTADALFRIAAGFSSMRVSTESLEQFDLRWLRAALDWDESRLAEWQQRRGGAFRDATRSWMAGTMIARAKIGEGQMWAGDRVLSAFAHAFRTGSDAWAREHGAAEDWRLIDELDVLAALPERLAAGAELPPELMDAPVFPFQTRELRTAGLEGADLVFAAFEDTLLRENRSPSLDDGPLARVRDAESPAEARAAAMAAAVQITKVAERRAREWGPDDEALYAVILEGGYDRFQVRLAEILDAALAQSPEEQRPHGIAFGEPFVEKALETRRYAIRDRGARARLVGGEPSTDLVLLVTRYSEDFSGFRVASKTRRIPIAIGPDHETPLASKLIGAVRSPFLVEVMQRAPDREELSDLKRKYRLPEEDRARILSLLDAAFLADEPIGGSGLEAWFDEELSGTAGYQEVQGLQDRIEGNREPIYRPKVDGRDVTLTFDIDLQYAAEDVLQHPEPPPASDRAVDDLWFEYPVGAIVLATVGGEILAAASVPVKNGEPVGPPVTDGERAYAIDRTLVRPRGQAPGSVMKPLLAAYALEYLGLDPEVGLEYCDVDRPRPGLSPKKSKNAGYGIVDCNSTYGHSHGSGRKLALMEALGVSCNVYFAALGERYFDPASMRAAYGMFGFGQPTGVQYDGNQKRGGIIDSYWHSPKSPLNPKAPDSEPGPVDRQYLGNGLVHVDVNVVQMTRAYAGLATGFLPEMTFVKKIGDEAVPRTISALDISNEHLELVREALFRVVNVSGGSAFGKGLSESELGFAFAAKTGSADYLKGLVPGKYNRGAPLDQYKGGGTRKHTWMAGWFPAREPRYVVVVYVHDTSATASHSAVYLAGQFLKRPEIKELMKLEREVDAQAATEPARALGTQAERR
ncbi:Stage V sporulation protein D [Planctomycetes bacterium Poly30]|uniref:beta-lactamase n=1 Tax=Saltatorellus ferox TaxID=2528018 RepID=A0A518EQX6_9BACT|nr:Stage V sporulation protein D [Planctomycetes bacterium Poly30]